MGDPGGDFPEMSEQTVIDALTTYLKERAEALEESIAVVGRGDAIPEVGAYIEVYRDDVEMVTAELSYLDLEMRAVAPAKQEGGLEGFRSACGFLKRALPSKDEEIRDELSEAIDAATDGGAKLHWYWHMDSPGDGGEDPHRHQRLQGLRLALEEVS